MPKRKLEDDDEWERHREDILRSYITEDKPLVQVIDILAGQGFKRTKPQYERTFKHWGVSKNIREEEWKFILGRLEEREHDHKTSLVHVRGISISASRLRKQKTKSRRTTFDQCLKKTGRLPRAKTPPGVKVITPPSSPASEVEHSIVTSTTSESSDVKAGYQPRLRMLPANFLTLPLAQQEEIWEEKISMITSSCSLPLTYSLDDLQLPLAENAVHLRNNPCPSEDTGTSCILSQSTLLNWLGTIVSAPHIHQKQDCARETAPGLPTDEVTRTSIETSIPKAILEHVNTDTVLLSMVRKVKNESDLYALRALLNLQGSASDTLSTLATRLLLPATIIGNLPFVQVLLEAGVDPDTQMHLSKELCRHTPQGSDLHPAMQRSQLEVHNRIMTPLHVAVSSGHETIVKVLLQHGATNWLAIFQGANGYVIGSILDVLMEMGMHHESSMTKFIEHRSNSHNILSTILRFGSLVAQQPQEMLSRALRLAILRNHYHSVRTLSSRYPELLESAKRTPWLYLEAAATLGLMKIFNFLTRKGFDPKATTSLGHGSPVAVAASNQGQELICQLRDAGVDINGTAFGVGTRHDLAQNITMSERTLSGIYGMTGLQIAIRNDDERLTRLLLYLGADANHFCHIYPIQLAAWIGSERIVRMLIEAGADVNAVYEGDLCKSSDLDQICSPNLSARSTATMIATERGHWQLAETLRGFQAGYIANSPVLDQWGGMALLDDAIVEQNTTLFNRLLSNAELPGGMLHPQHGSRALILAIRHQRTRLITSLFCAGANPYVRIDPEFEGLEDFDNSHGMEAWESPFERAIMLGDLAMIERILECSRNFLSEEQRIASNRQLSFAYAFAICSRNQRLKVILSRHGLDSKEVEIIMGPNYVQHRLYVALQHASESNNFAEVEALLDAGAPPDSPNMDTAKICSMSTPLQYAVKHNVMPVVERLRDAGAAINAEPHIVEGRTALQLAAANGNVNMVEFLINAGALVNARPAVYNGRTALEAAAEHGHKEVATYLLRDGAQIQGQENCHYRRSIYRAWENGHHIMVDLLYDWMVDQCGVEDAQLPEDLIASVKEEELLYIDEAAKLEYEAYRLEYDSASDADEDEYDAEVTIEADIGSAHEAEANS